MAEEIKEPTGCIVCGCECQNFTFCVDCGVEKFVSDFHGSDPLDYVKRKNPERYEHIMKWFEQTQTTNTHEKEDTHYVD